MTDIDTLKTRTVRRIVPARRTLEGEGFEVRRALPAPGIEAVGPFIFLDHFGPVDYAPGEAKGAPNHPHRGFETLTYMVEGGGLHRDSLGNVSRIGAGEAQWMRAGSGVLHDEGADEAMRRDGGRSHGVQFWINLPRGRKMSPPAYAAVTRDRIPELPLGGGSLRLIAGTLEAHRGPVETFANPWLAFLALPEGTTATVAADPAELAIYVLSGEVSVDGDRVVGEGQLAILTPGEVVRLRALGTARAFLLGGDPLDAPIRRWGPFVMNSDQELQQAMRDFQAGLFGQIPSSLPGVLS